MSSERALSLSDIAQLAQVRRPVVSMWRRRPRVRGVEFPFPAPITTEGPSERFDRDEIVAWLESTGRGNNRQTRLDAPTFTTPDDADIEDVATLLCLAALTGEELAGLDQDQLIALAEGVDRGDQLLLREVRAGAANRDLLAYVDDLVEASYGPADALVRAESSSLGRGTSERGSTPELVALLHAVVSASREHLSEEQAVLIPPSDPRLTLPLAEGFTGLRLEGDDPQVRSLRRRATIGDVELVTGDGAAVQVLTVFDKVDGEALLAVDDLVLGLAAREIAVVIGSATLLCDPLSGEADQRRAETLRLGKLALALRLPRGLWRDAPRQHLAIWVIRGGEGAQRLRIADLDGEGLDLEDLASDVAGALQRSEQRAYRYARIVDLSQVLASGPVVPRGTRAVRFGTSAMATSLDRVQTATLITSENIPGYDVTAAAGPGQVVLRHRSLSELVSAGQLTMRRGNRIDLTAAVPGGSVRVLSADGSTDGVQLDPFDAARMYRRANRTEPGDVIFLEHQRPIALVDNDGGALVASPSRILRLHVGAPIGPHALAALINETVAAGSDWPTWSVPDLQPATARALDTALAAAAAHLRTLRRHERAMQDLTRNLIDGVAAGAITLNTVTQKAG